MGPFLWSVRVSRFWEPWEAWVETEKGRVIRCTLDFGWTRESAERKARKRYRKFMAGSDIPGTKQGKPVNREGAVT